MNVQWYSTQLTDLQQDEQGYLWMALHRPQCYHFEAGQYATFRLTDDEGDFQRSYSIASAPRIQGQLEFCIRISNDGRGTSFFKKLRPGQALTLSHPLGQFKVVETERPLVFIAGGSGISPIRSFIHQLLHPGRHSSSQIQIQLLYCCKDTVGIPFRGEFEKLASSYAGRFSLCLFAENGIDKGVTKGNVVQALLEANSILPSAHYYLCGPATMIEVAQEILMRRDIPKSHIFFEKYG